ncbi:MAG: hypothetical protein ACYSUN_03740 [Planctomycetota bacterium]|jgi:hypothetical protein
MRLAGLLLLCAVAAAEEPPPLGPYARPGVPVLVDGREEVTLDGWTFELDGLTMIHPPRTPFRACGHEFREVPAGVLLVGVAGATLEPKDGQRIIPVNLRGLRLQHWRALDLFDRIVLGGGATPSAEARSSLVQWVRAGGCLVAVGLQPFDQGLGQLSTAISLEEALRKAGPVRPLLISRPGRVRPDIYALLRHPNEPPPALAAARWIVIGTTVALVVQLLLGAYGLISKRALLLGFGAVALLGALVGLVRTRADYEPVARGRVEVRYRDGGTVRIRNYRVFTAVGPGASVRAGPDWAPILFRAGGDAWWPDRSRRCPLGDGVIRVFLTERLEDGAVAPEARSEEDPNPGLRDREEPVRGAWKAVAVSGSGAPAASSAGILLIAGVEFVAQR